MQRISVMGKHLIKKTAAVVCMTILINGIGVFDCKNINAAEENYEIVNMWGEETSVEKHEEETVPEVSKNPEEYKTWAVDSEEWKEIFAKPEQYPNLMLEDLERNPEILEYVYGYPDASKEVQGGLTEKEKEETCPLLMQWDSRWGYVEYGSYNIGISGCGPTSLSMVLYGFTREETLTPDYLAGVAMEKGYYVKGSGTAWTFMTQVAQEYGVEVSQTVSLEKEKMIENLENGGLIICSMRPGDFTNTGHFIVVCGYDGEKFKVNDPFSYTNSAKLWDFETLEAQAKQVWYYRYQTEDEGKS